MICKNTKVWERGHRLTLTHSRLTFLIFVLNNKMTVVFPDGSAVKNPSGMQETWVWSLGLEDLLEKEMATHSSILAWRIPWTEEPGRQLSMRSQRVRHNLETKQLQQQQDCGTTLSKKIKVRELNLSSKNSSFTLILSPCYKRSAFITLLCRYASHTSSLWLQIVTAMVWI